MHILDISFLVLIALCSRSCIHYKEVTKHNHQNTFAYLIKSVDRNFKHHSYVRIFDVGTASY